MSSREGNKVKRQIIFIWIFLSFCLVVHAQFEAQTSQYMFHLPVYNPAAIAEESMIDVSGQYRMQWIGMPGAPQTTYFTLNAPLFTDNKVTQGIGIKFLNDKIGAFSNQSAHLQYAYKRKFGKGTASLGMDIGFASIGFKYDSIKTAAINSEYHDFLGDTAIPTADVTGMSMDLSLGAFYSAPQYYMGLSYVHLNNPLIKFNNDKTQFKVKGVLYLTGGWNRNLADPKFTFHTTTLLKTDLTTWQAEISAYMELNKKYWGGVSYRFQDAVVIFGGLDITNGLRVGYSYDLPTGKMLTVSSGSHEIYLSYRFLFDKGNKFGYKSIRIL